jgi:hypothetical protein
LLLLSTAAFLEEKLLEETSLAPPSDKHHNIKNPKVNRLSKVIALRRRFPEKPKKTKGDKRRPGLL